MSESPIRVAICGGGIGGLSLALVLKKFAPSAKLSVDIYEAGTQFVETGAGITLWQRSRNIFESLGLQDVLKGRVISPPLILRKSDTKDAFSFFEFAIPHGSSTLPRVEMLNLLIEQLDFESSSFIRTHFSKSLASYAQDESGVTLHFSDGSTAHADIVVGADGLGSPTRKQMYADLAGRLAKDDPEKVEALLKASRPSWTGTYAYRALVARSKIAAASPNNVILKSGYAWLGSGKHVISYPISPTIINILFFDTVPDGLDKPLPGAAVAAASKEEILELYSDWEEDICVVAENVGETAKWAISHIRGLPHYVDGHVALLGDSAHAMSTHFGAGAGQALEDAYILGRILAHQSVSRPNLAHALDVYDAIRRPIGNDVVERSLKLGFLYELHPAYLAPGIDAARLRAGDRAELHKLVEQMTEIWTFHWQEMPERDWERAQEPLAKNEAVPLFAL